MQIFKFSSLSSTSTHAAQLAREGQVALPFAVWADTQTEGRGRQGRSWLSPSGGLYVTIAAAAVPGRNQGLDVLRAGVLVVSVFEELLKIRLTLKWPNDVLWDGRKVGGILCESTVLGNEWGPSIVGIGMNVASVKSLGDLGPSADYEPIALEDVVAQRLPDNPVKALAEALCGAFAERWSRLADGDVLAQYGRYALQPGHMAWEHGDDGVVTGSTLWWKGPSANGAGRFGRQSPEGEVIEFHTVSRCPRWTGQIVSRLPRVVCDLGNTALKWGVFRKGELVKLGRMEHREWQQNGLAALNEDIAWPQKDFPTTLIPIFYASVRPQLNRLFEEAAKGLGLWATAIEKNTRRVWGAHYGHEQLGIDRLAAMEGLLERLNEERARESSRADDPSSWHLIVSGGTALTWDLISFDGEHRGGLIGAGMNMQLESLAKSTGQLPDLSVADCVREFENMSGDLPQTTRQAMAMAVVENARGTRDRLNELAARSNARIVAIWTCGGDGEALAGWLGGTYVPDLILSGLRRIAWG